ncbi:MAG TPA: bifunctional diaminohydroxyphosphoribosylaminopyrimidine deaminase/5-amino-6-(5-phosphoribosylamino)uracil reductase RibD [Bacteroidota bacterium]|nr:bifunctional diaminohydroxyphosphoribosylaminopyrimidine deaminase/5-amino-6-(5-phosphoribosylamino)uracil reductase RibD [Bacteroidota bacterium]
MMTKARKIELMRHCFELALHGAGKVSPNPMVGCVIVHDNKIIGEGFHHRFGGPHAEVYALQQAGPKAKGAALFVSLEPCSHFGKTPPCTNAIIAAGIKKVYIAVEDPNPLVSGKGIQKLRQAGIHVEVGILKNYAETLNEKFMTFMRTGLPFVAVKIAQTLDGKIADGWGNSKWITSEQSRRIVHQMRAEYDAVLVGAKTVNLDNPELTVRLAKGKNPVRIVVDGHLSASASQKIFRTTEAQTLVLTSSTAMKRNARKVRQMEKLGVRILAVGRQPKLSPRTILQALTQERISSVLIEGGSHTIASFLEAHAVQKVYCFIAPTILGSGLQGLVRPQQHISEIMHLKNISYNLFGPDVFIEGSL